MSPARRPRVCMLLEREETERDGRVRREVRALAGDGYAVTVLHHAPDETGQAALRADGARTRSVRPGRRRLPRPLLWARYAWCAIRERPDAVHAHDLPMLAPAWLAARVSGAALVYDTHEYAAGVPYHSPLARRAARLLQRVLVRRCDAVIAVSPEAARQLRQDHRLAAEPAVVRNVPAADWPGAPGAAAPVRELRAELGGPLVLHQGAATRNRGCVELVAATARLPGAQLLFLGDVEPGFAAELRDAARRHGSAERVHLRPSVPLEVLLAHTRQADVGVCLSDPAWLNHRLTLSNKLFEYIAAGLPVVAARDTAFGALVEELGVGVTVPFGDVAALAAGVARALEMRDRPDVAQRLAEAAGGLRWELERERLLDVYRRLPATSRHAQRSAV